MNENLIRKDDPTEKNNHSKIYVENKDVSKSCDYD